MDKAQFEKLVIKTLHEMVRDLKILGEKENDIYLKAVSIEEYLKLMKPVDVILALKDTSSEFYKAIPIIDLARNEKTKVYLDILSVIQPELKQVESALSVVIPEKEIVDIDCAKVLGIEKTNENKQVLDFTNDLVKDITGTTSQLDPTSLLPTMMSMMSSVNNGGSVENLSGISEMVPGVRDLETKIEGKIKGFDQDTLLKQTMSIYGSIKNNPKLNENPLISGLLKSIDQMAGDILKGSQETKE